MDNDKLKFLCADVDCVGYGVALTKATLNKEVPLGLRQISPQNLVSDPNDVH